MATLDAVLAELKRKGSEKTRTIYVKHGTPPARALGVSVADLKLIAKPLKREQDLAYALYDTGLMEAMYLAGMLANGALMSRPRLQGWAEGSAGIPMIAQYTVPWVAVENIAARDLALAWIASKTEYVACSGWCTYSGLATTKPDEALDLKEMERLLDSIAGGIHQAPNRVRLTMNQFVIAVGAYVVPLFEKAKSTARSIGTVEVDQGDTACTVPDALDMIAKVQARGKAKRKTIRC